MDTTRSLSLFHQAGVPILGVIENMSSLQCPHCGEPIEVFSRSTQAWAVEETHLTQLGRIPLHPAISGSLDENHPLVQAVPDSPEAVTFRQIASKVIRMFAK